MADAQDTLRSAINVLEEEIAAGIVAAKKLENKVIDVEEVRNQDPRDLMSRIRRDTHDAVDILLDAATVLFNQFSALSENFRKKDNGLQMKSADQVQVLENEGKATPGQQVEIPVLLTNDSDTEEMAFELTKTDLSSPAGVKILARNITLQPKVVLLKPAGEKEILIRVKIPKSCPAGRFSGLIQDNRNLNVRSMLTIEVE